MSSRLNSPVGLSDLFHFPLYQILSSYSLSTATLRNLYSDKLHLSFELRYPKIISTVYLSRSMITLTGLHFHYTKSSSKELHMDATCHTFTHGSNCHVPTFHSLMPFVPAFIICHMSLLYLLIYSI
jgi:hypothetical protein